MHITLHPQRSADSLAVIKQGDILTINGEAFDFSGVLEGATLPMSAIDCDFIAGAVTRESGVLHMTLILPHGSNASEAARFPVPIVNPANGVLELPA